MPPAKIPRSANRKLPDPKDRIQVYEAVSEALEDSQHGRFQESIDKLKTTLATEENSVPSTICWD